MPTRERHVRDESEQVKLRRAKKNFLRMQDLRKRKKSKIRPWRPPAASRRPKAAEVLSSARPHCCRPDLSSYGEHVGLDSSWLAGLLDRWAAEPLAGDLLIDGLLDCWRGRLADHVHGPATARTARFWFAVPKGESHAGRTSNLSRLEAQEQRELSVTGCISVIGILHAPQLAHCRRIRPSHPPPLN
ncbi:hypothetical protein J3E68DRAFT_289251 [Trichoderma sp. SZMC 28012]